VSEFYIYNWIIVVLMLCVAVSAVIPFWKIFARAGWPGALALLMIVPFLNFVLLWVLAFKAWPGDEKAKQ